MKNIIKGIIYTAITVFVLWVTLSFIDIVSNNRMPNPQYSEYNILVNEGRE